MCVYNGVRISVFRTHNPLTRIPKKYTITITLAEELVRRTQQEFLARVTKGLPPTMTFVYAIGNNDLWPNNKNSAHNFEVRCWLCVLCVYICMGGPQRDGHRTAQSQATWCLHLSSLPPPRITPTQALYDLMEQHCPDTCAIFKGAPQEIAENKKLFREGGYYVFR